MFHCLVYSMLHPVLIVVRNMIPEGPIPCTGSGRTEHIWEKNTNHMLQSEGLTKFHFAKLGSAELIYSQLSCQPAQPI